MEIIAAQVATLAVAVVVIAVVQRWPWQKLERRRVLVVVDDGARTFEGVLWRRRGPLLVLRNVTTFGPGDKHGIPVDGELVIERRRVSWIQTP